MARSRKSNLSRRRFLLLSGTAGLGAYSYHRGLRYPRLSFEHKAIATDFELDSVRFEFEHAIHLAQSVGSASIGFRAIAPEPIITVSASHSTIINISIANLAMDTSLKVDGPASVSIHEEIDGINRSLRISFSGEQAVRLRWRLAEQSGAKFAIIGDTGAGLELEWVLHRAEQLGAQFLLHLGDFNYSDGEYQRAIELFGLSLIPCYVSIGNHDFNDSGLVYQNFIEQIGPMNHSFNVAGSRFVNIDSAADFFPASAGRRGDLFKKLRRDEAQYFDQVFFTHRPFADPREGRSHVIGGIGEVDWLNQQITNLGGNSILTGHVHRSAELDYQGMHQWTVGEGLGFEDIVHQKRVARLLIGTVEMGNKVNYQWRPLDMPWASHLSPTHEIKLIKEQPPEKLRWYRQHIILNSSVDSSS